jgi:hypothetical protein
MPVRGYPQDFFRISAASAASAETIAETRGVPGGGSTYNPMGQRSCPWITIHMPQKERAIAKNRNQNTFAKRQREQEKKRKAEDKLARRLRRKESGTAPASQPPPED